MSSQPTVYLAGPINEYMEDQRASSWRQLAVQQLALFGITGVCPMRGEERVLEGSTPMKTNKAILGRDHHDCTTCDAVIVNFLGAQKASIGTSMECAWCYDHHKNVIAIIEPIGNVHDHEMLSETWTYRVTTIEAATEIADWMLAPYK